MRISTAQMQLQGTRAMLDRFSDLATTQNQLAVGKRIIKPSDDPLGTARMLPLNEIISIHEQYNKNSDAAETRLELEDGTLGSVIDVLQRVHELSIQASNTTLSMADRSNIAAEVSESLKSLLGMANTRESNGDYLFAGDDVATTPFTEAPAGTFNYVGDNGQRNLQIGPTRQIAVGDPGDDVFMNIPFSGGGNQSLFETIDTFVNELQSGTPSPNIATDIKAAMSHIVTFRSKAGARLNAIDTHRNLNDELILQSTTSVSNIEDLDYAEAISRMNLQMVGLQASQQSFERIQNLSLFNYL